MAELTPEREADFEKCVTPPGDCRYDYDPRPDGQLLLKEVRDLRAKVAALEEAGNAMYAVLARHNFQGIDYAAVRRWREVRGRL